MHLFYFSYCIFMQRANSLFYSSHPYNCKIFMEHLHVGGTWAVCHTVACCVGAPRQQRLHAGNCEI